MFMILSEDSISIYGGPYQSATAKLTFPLRNLLFHSKLTFSRKYIAYFFTAKLTFSGEKTFFTRQNLLSHGKTYFSKAKKQLSRGKKPKFSTAWGGINNKYVSNGRP